MCVLLEKVSEKGPARRALSLSPSEHRKPRLPCQTNFFSSFVVSWEEPLKRFPAKRVVPLACGKSIVSGGVWGG